MGCHRDLFMEYGRPIALASRSKSISSVKFLACFGYS